MQDLGFEFSNLHLFSTCCLCTKYSSVWFISPCVSRAGGWGVGLIWFLSTYKWGLHVRESIKE